MPQFLEFPALPPGEYRAAVDALIKLCRQTPAEGEGARDHRARLKQLGLWNRERVRALYRFLKLGVGERATPSPLMREVAAASDDDAARIRLSDRLWEVNPVLFQAVLLQLKERVQSENELLKYLDSFAYTGNRITGPQVRGWVRMAQGLELFKLVGIRLALSPQGEKLLARAEAFDLDEYLEDDVDEPEPIVEDEPGSPSTTAAAARSTPSTPVVLPTAGLAAEAVPAEPEWSSPRVAPTPSPTLSRVPPPGASPHGALRPVPIARFTGADLGVFRDDVLDETSQRIATWARSLSADAVIDDTTPPSALGLDASMWQEDADRALFKLCVAGALALRLPQARLTEAWSQLEASGVLDALYDGTAPDANPGRVDPLGLMWASLVARRFAEVAGVSADLERASSAAEAFEALHQSLGRGLLSAELVWVMRGLDALGVLRFDDMASVTGLASRPLRDTLYRLGFIATPYAGDALALAAASRALRRAVGRGPEAERTLEAFARAAGCAYDCAQRKTCGFACRERADV